MESKEIKVNLGCGHRFRPDWINLDMASSSPDVVVCNFLEGIPLPNDSVAFLYHSHVLEHLSKAEGENFLKDCYRVLKPGGILRVVVPDLEDITREYIHTLDECLAGDRTALNRLEWLHIELYDQLAREYPGGEYVRFLQGIDLNNDDFVPQRIGSFVGVFEGCDDDVSKLKKTNAQSATIKAKLQNRLRRIHDGVVKLLLGSKDRKALEIGRFRLSGETHKWMFDRVTLSHALLLAGFSKTHKCRPDESTWQGWRDNNLDLDSEGNVYHAHSLYMEATRGDANI